jgi:hypothetical protein
MPELWVEERRPLLRSNSGPNRVPPLRELFAVLGIAFAACCGAGCAESTKPSRAPAGGERPAVAVIAHSYFPRLESEDYWETISLADAGGDFLLVIQPRIRTPAEGPWRATFRDSGGRVLVSHRNLRVDVATGQFTFLCTARSFTPGDWTLELEVEEGGLVSAERKRLYRFRVL